MDDFDNRRGRGGRNPNTKLCEDNLLGSYKPLADELKREVKAVR